MNKILLVEDDETLNANIKLSLETEGYSVIAVRTVAAAEAAAPDADLIILDVTLPDDVFLRVRMCDYAAEGGE